MILELKKIAKKFNLNYLEKSITEDFIETNEISCKGEILSRKENNFSLVVSISEELDQKILKKVNLLIICEVSDLTKVQIEKLLSYNKPIFYSSFTKREIISTLDSYLLRKQQSPERIHGTLISIFGEGVLIIGKPGIGKSELALELVNRKHLFIGDDAVDVISFAGNPIGKAPKLTRDFIEVRGVGIINIKGMFGIQSVLKEAEIKLILNLVNLNEIKISVDRLGKEYSFKEIAGVEVPLIQIPIASGRSIASVVESAVIAFKQRKFENYIAVDDLTDRMKNS